MASDPLDLSPAYWPQDPAPPPHQPVGTRTEVRQATRHTGCAHSPTRQHTGCLKTPLNPQPSLDTAPPLQRAQDPAQTPAHRHYATDTQGPAARDPKAHLYPSVARYRPQNPQPRSPASLRTTHRQADPATGHPQPLNLQTQHTHQAGQHLSWEQLGPGSAH